MGRLRKAKTALAGRRGRERAVRSALNMHGAHDRRECPNVQYIRNVRAPPPPAAAALLAHLVCVELSHVARGEGGSNAARCLSVCCCCSSPPPSPRCRNQTDRKDDAAARNVSLYCTRVPFPSETFPGNFSPSCLREEFISFRFLIAMTREASRCPNVREFIKRLIEAGVGSFLVKVLRYFQNRARLLFAFRRDKIFQGHKKIQKLEILKERWIKTDDSDTISRCLGNFVGIQRSRRFHQKGDTRTAIAEQLEIRDCEKKIKRRRSDNYKFT